MDNLRQKAIVDTPIIILSLSAAVHFGSIRATYEKADSIFSPINVYQSLFLISILLLISKYTFSWNCHKYVSEADNYMFSITRIVFSVAIATVSHIVNDPDYGFAIFLILFVFFYLQEQLFLFQITSIGIERNLKRYLAPVFVIYISTAASLMICFLLVPSKSLQLIIGFSILYLLIIFSTVYFEKRFSEIRGVE